MERVQPLVKEREWRGFGHWYRRGNGEGSATGKGEGMERVQPLVLEREWRGFSHW